MTDVPSPIADRLTAVAPAPVDESVVRQSALSSTRVRRVLWIVGSFLAVLVASAAAGPDANWDLLNYHYNNGRAFVTGSFVSDVAAANIQSWLHPLIDAPVYIAIELTDSKWGLILWSAVVQWFCYWSVWRLTACFQGIRESIARRALALAVVATGAGAYSLAFTTFGDWIVAALLCEATRVILTSLDESARSTTWRGHNRDVVLQVVAGLFLGLALSVKLASGTFAIGIVVGVAVVVGLAAAGRVVLGTALSGAVVSGPWMLYLTIRYGNPVFPFYNGIFKSDSMPPGNFDDRRYGSHGLADVVRFPVEMWRGGTTYTELPLRDWRYAAVLIMLATIAAFATTSRVRAMVNRREATFLGIMLGLGFVSWIVAFGIYRYFLFGEIMASLVLVVLVARLVSDDWRFAVIVIALLPIGFAYEVFPAWGRGDVFDNPQLDALVESRVDGGSRVVFAAGPPMGYLTEAFPASTRFAAVDGFFNGTFLLGGQLEDDVHHFVSKGLDDDALFVIADQGVTSLPAPFDTLRITDCEDFNTVGRVLELCRATGQ